MTEAHAAHEPLSTNAQAEGLLEDVTEEVSVVTEEGSVLMEDSAVPQDPARAVRVLLYSSDATTRQAVISALGTRPAEGLEIVQMQECATPKAVIDQVDHHTFDLLILDGEATPYGGMGLCRQLKHEIFECPPTIVLTGRPQDAWLATWSFADAAVSHPLDPFVLTRTVCQTLGATALV